MERALPQLEESLAPARERWGVPGLAVGVLEDGDVVTAADGLCELGSPEPVSPETVFRIASITKPFVATLAMSLVQDGLLSLDERPPGSTAEATVRQLLSNQGGLAPEWPVPFDGSDESDEAIFRLLEGEPERLPVGPGELFSYCNAGFWLVAAGIQRTLGITFEEAMHERVLEPLGLTSTSFVSRGAAAQGHNQVEPGADEHAPLEYVYPRARRASGGLWSSVGDLLRFAEHHLGGPGPLTAESVAEMQRPLIASHGFDYGLGWFLSERRGRLTVEHGGSAAGYQSLLLLVPGEGVAVAALSNSSRGALAIRDVLAELGLAEEESTFVEPGDLSEFAGRYRGQKLELTVEPEEDGLVVGVAEIDPFKPDRQVYPAMVARRVGEREFELVDGDWVGERFDFPRPGLARMTVLAQRVE
jgi:CubicO group peptidase (beta-lactamase class C family)